MKTLASNSLVGILATSAFSQTVTKIDLAKDNGKGKPGPVVKSFETKDHPLHCVVHLQPLTSSLIFTGILFATKAANLTNYKVASVDLTASMKMDFVDFKFNLPKPWPVGSYRIEIKVNRKPLKDVAFEIK